MSLHLLSFCRGYGDFEIYAAIVLCWGIIVAGAVVAGTVWVLATAIVCALKGNPIRNGMLKAGILVSFLLSTLTVLHSKTVNEYSVRAGGRLRIMKLGGNSFLADLHEDAHGLMAQFPEGIVNWYIDAAELPHTFRRLGAGKAIGVRSPHGSYIKIIVRPGRGQSEWMVVSGDAMEDRDQRGIRVYDGLYRL